jgi:hypothetical protein
VLPVLWLMIGTELHLDSEVQLTQCSVLGIIRRRASEIDWPQDLQGLLIFF